MSSNQIRKPWFQLLRILKSLQNGTMTNTCPCISKYDSKNNSVSLTSDMPPRRNVANSQRGNCAKRNHDHFQLVDKLPSIQITGTNISVSRKNSLLKKHFQQWSSESKVLRRQSMSRKIGQASWNPTQKVM